MSNEKIYNKRCFIKRADGKAYCSKCGKLILQDEYNMKQHAQKCGFSEHDFMKMYREGKDFVCAWKGKGDELVFSVYTPKLQLRPGFSDRYSGGTWKCVYRCFFSLREKKIREAEGGLQNLEFWKQYDLESLNLESHYDIIKRYFHIPGYKDFNTFVNIYLGKGYRYKELMTDEEAHDILQQVKTGSPDIWHGAGGHVGYIRGVCMYTKDEGKPVLCLTVKSVYQMKIYRFLIAQDYFYSEDKIDVKNLLREPLLCMVSEGRLQKFAQCYPGIGLMNYWNVSKRNLLIPLLAPNFDDGLELLSKAGCTSLANHFYTHKAFGPAREKKCGDIKEWLGVPVKVLRKVREECLQIEDFLDVLEETYRKAPEYLEMGNITYAVIRYLKENVLAQLNKKRTSITGFARMDKKVKLRIARYLEEISSEGEAWESQRDYRMYVDYLNMSRANGEYGYGYTPENLDLAHDFAMEHHQQFAFSSMHEKKFEKRVSEEEYESLESGYIEEAEQFEADTFFIRAPRNTAEMVNESTMLHHCVRIYSNRVASGQTNIYFLRKKEKPEEPFATIEVCGNRILQLKAKCNQKAPEDARKFVRKWADVKGLVIESSDLA